MGRIRKPGMDPQHEGRAVPESPESRKVQAGPHSAPPAARLGERLQRFLRWQLRTDCEGLPLLDEAGLRAPLDGFERECVDRVHRLPWNDAQRRRWRAVCDALVAAALAQPQAAVHREAMTLQRLQHASDAEADGTSPAGRVALLDGTDLMRGPMLWDLAGLLCDPGLAADESRQLDAMVRWWQEARHSEAMREHPMATDFGECWRALEWTMVLQALGRIGSACRDIAEVAGSPPSERIAPHFRDITRIALRYAPLAPLLSLLEPISGQTLADGFTF